MLIKKIFHLNWLQLVDNYYMDNGRTSKNALDLYSVFQGVFTSKPLLVHYWLHLQPQLLYMPWQKCGRQSAASFTTTRLPLTVCNVGEVSCLKGTTAGPGWSGMWTANPLVVGKHTLSSKLEFNELPWLFLLLGCAEVKLLEEALMATLLVYVAEEGGLSVWLRRLRFAWFNYWTFDVCRRAERCMAACVHKLRHTHFLRKRSHFLAEGIFCERVGGWPGQTCQAILASHFDSYVFL